MKKFFILLLYIVLNSTDTQGVVFSKFAPDAEQVLYKERISFVAQHQPDHYGIETPIDQGTVERLSAGLTEQDPLFPFFQRLQAIATFQRFQSTADEAIYHRGLSLYTDSLSILLNLSEDHPMKYWQEYTHFLDHFNGQGVAFREETAQIRAKLPVVFSGRGTGMDVKIFVDSIIEILRKLVFINQSPEFFGWTPLERTNFLNVTFECFVRGVFAGKGCVPVLLDFICKNSQQGLLNFCSANLFTAATAMSDLTFVPKAEALGIFKRHVPLAAHDPRNAGHTQNYLNVFYSLAPEEDDYECALSVANFAFQQSRALHWKYYSTIQHSYRAAALIKENKIDQAKRHLQTAGEIFESMLDRLDERGFSVPQPFILFSPQENSDDDWVLRRSDVIKKLSLIYRDLGQDDKINRLFMGQMDRAFESLTSPARRQEAAAKKPAKKNAVLALAKAAVASREKAAREKAESASRPQVQTPTVRHAPRPLSQAQSIAPDTEHVEMPKKPPLSQQPAPKIKRRGVANPPEAPAAAAAAAAEPEDEGPLMMIEDLIKGDHLAVFRSLFQPSPRVLLKDVVNLLNALGQEDKPGKGSHTKVNLAFKGMGFDHEALIVLPHQDTLAPYIILQLKEKFLSFGLYPSELRERLEKQHPEYFQRD